MQLVESEVFMLLIFLEDKLDHRNVARDSALIKVVDRIYHASRY